MHEVIKNKMLSITIIPAPGKYKVLSQALRGMINGVDHYIDYCHEIDIPCDNAQELLEELRALYHYQMVKEWHISVAVSKPKITYPVKVVFNYCGDVNFSDFKTLVDRFNRIMRT